MSNIQRNNGSVVNNSRVYTKIKFTKSSKTDSIVGFVYQDPVSGRVRGVRENSKYPKKICVLDKHISDDVLLNVLYDCTLVPMTNKNGYVVIAIEPVQFDAVITTSYIKNNIYKVEVCFGNKTILFDPYTGKRDSVRLLDQCKEILSKRVDVKNLLQVVDDFEIAGQKLITLMLNDKYNHDGVIK